jgi:hypothetical protein
MAPIQKKQKTMMAPFRSPIMLPRPAKTNTTQDDEQSREPSADANEPYDDGFVNENSIETMLYDNAISTTLNQAAVEKEDDFRNHHDESKESRLYNSCWYTAWLRNEEDEEDHENEEECSESELSSSFEEGDDDTEYVSTVSTVYLPLL